MGLVGEFSRRECLYLTRVWPHVFSVEAPQSTDPRTIQRCGLDALDCIAALGIANAAPLKPLQMLEDVVG